MEEAPNARVLSRKVPYLERSLETLKAAYQESVQQKSTLRIDMQVAEKKCEQQERTIQLLEMELEVRTNDNNCSHPSSNSISGA